MAGNFKKDPNALLDYKIDWQDWLDGDGIVSAAVSLSAISAADQAVTASIRVANQHVSANQQSHVIWLSAGVVGTEYSIISRVWTSAGRRNDQSITVLIEEQ